MSIHPTEKRVCFKKMPQITKNKVTDFCNYWQFRYIDSHSYCIIYQA